MEIHACGYRPKQGRIWVKWFCGSGFCSARTRTRTHTHTRTHTKCSETEA